MNNVEKYYGQLEFLEVANIDMFKGKIINEIAVAEDKSFILFKFKDGEKYLMHHEQDCCEWVHVEDICGDLDNLLNTPIIMAEEISQDGGEGEGEFGCESSTWTFYKFATINGYVTIRWLGESNGYYSESVDLAKVKFDEKEER